ncbi:MAG: NAD(FAD)-utilizing dehydrogenase [Chloroflexi bacterium]|nr:NAD(FAD)-utilizing dehydrogenase [Chloroflexota bacterium]
MVETYSTAVIGGGAAGICAAISTARRGESVVICEKLSRLGRKILASGDGRCNLLNDDLSESGYNPASRGLVKSVFGFFDRTAILDFFKGLGLEVYSREGRIFPITNQAASVLKVLEMELKRLAVPVKFNFACSGISLSPEGVLIESAGGPKVKCRKVIIAGGGKTYPAFGSDGSTYAIASRLGHTLIEPVPAAVPLIVKDSLCQLLQGQRIQAAARSLIGSWSGGAVRGELLFTKYGLSGTCILDISEEISIAINRRQEKEIFIAVDMVPFLDQKQLRDELEKRRAHRWPAEEMLVGILPNKVGLALKDRLAESDLDAVVRSLKDRRFKVSGTRGWNEAEFTSGGIAVGEIDPRTLESKLCPGVFFAGEVLDVNGRRGGYNLGWAWASGLVAGLKSRRG